MRTILWLAVAAAMLWPTGALADGTYFIRRSDGSQEAVACGAWNDVYAVDGSVAMTWEPPCAEVTSGDVLTFHGGVNLAHDPGSELDDPSRFLDNRDSQCFRSATSGSYTQLSRHGTYRLRFTYDSAGVTASYLDPATGWSPPRDCPLASDLQQSSLHTAVIPYRCFFHSQMQGLIVVQSLGSIG